MAPRETPSLASARLGYPDVVRRRSTRRQRRRESILTRAARFLRSLFSSTPPDADDPRGFTGGLGVREPRRPLRPLSSGAVALEAPPEDTRDVWAVGEDDGR
jgi:hypothetical protein